MKLNDIIENTDVKVAFRAFRNAVDNITAALAEVSEIEVELAKIPARREELLNCGKKASLSASARSLSDLNGEMEILGRRKSDAEAAVGEKFRKAYQARKEILHYPVLLTQHLRTAAVEMVRQPTPLNYHIGKAISFSVVSKAEELSRISDAGRMEAREIESMTGKPGPSLSDLNRYVAILDWLEASAEQVDELVDDYAKFAAESETELSEMKATVDELMKLPLKA